MKPVCQIKLPDIMCGETSRSLLQVLNQENGMQALYVGGCVRDVLLGRPVTDLDIATTLMPEEVNKVCQAAGLSVIPTGEKHGTLTVRVGKQAFEVTTLRRDIDTDGRHATVIFTQDWAEDASRRDFTMNTLLCDAQGYVYDPLGSGLTDLEAGHVIFVGEPQERIQEDFLRILRFFRFYTYYGQGEPDKKALDACCKEARHLNRLSRERITQEFHKIMMSSRLMEVLGLMHKCGVFPELLGEGYMSEWLERLVSLQENNGSSFYLSRLFVLFEASRKKVAASEEYLVYSNHEKKLLRQIYVLWGSVKELNKFPVTYMLYLHGRLLAIQGYLLFCAQHNLTLSAEKWNDLLNGQIPVFPVKGNDLKVFALEEGPELGRILKDIETWWIEHDFMPDHAACIAKAKDLIG